MTESILVKKFEIYNHLTEEEKSKLTHVNCCEHILRAGNEAFQLNLSKSALSIAKGFGGGMKIESTCGAVTGGVMVLSILFSEREDFDDIIQTYMLSFKTQHSSLDCGPLKEDHRREDTGCQSVILMASKVLDQTVRKYRSL